MSISEIPPAESHLRFTLQQVSQRRYKNKHKRRSWCQHFQRKSLVFLRNGNPTFTFSVFSIFFSVKDLNLYFSKLKSALVVQIEFHCRCQMCWQKFITSSIKLTEELQAYPFHWFCSSVLLYWPLHREDSFEFVSHFGAKESHFFEAITDSTAWWLKFYEILKCFCELVGLAEVYVDVSVVVWHSWDHCKPTSTLCYFNVHDRIRALVKAPLFITITIDCEFKTRDRIHAIPLSKAESTEQRILELIDLQMSNLLV